MASHRKTNLLERLKMAGRIFFLVLYVVYGISPLSYSFDVKSILNIEEEDTSRATPKLYVLDLICERVETLLRGKMSTSSGEKQLSAADDEGDLFLAKKRRAVASTKKYFKKIEEVKWVFGHEDIRDSELSLSLAAFDKPLFQSLDGHHFIHSGLAPPRV